MSAGRGRARGCSGACACPSRAGCSSRWRPSSVWSTSWSWGTRWSDGGWSPPRHSSPSARRLRTRRRPRRGVRRRTSGATWTRPWRLGCRMLLVLAGLPEPQVNLKIRDEDGEVLRKYDLSYPAVRVAVEYNGKVDVLTPRSLGRGPGAARCHRRRRLAAPSGDQLRDLRHPRADAAPRPPRPPRAARTGPEQPRRILPPRTRPAGRRPPQVRDPAPAATPPGVRHSPATPTARVAPWCPPPPPPTAQTVKSAGWPR